MLIKSLYQTSNDWKWKFSDYPKQHKILYICGMSVPPVMIKRIVTRLIEKGLYKYKGV